MKSDNIVSISGTSKKRRATTSFSSSDQFVRVPVLKKKRAVLGEITNLTNTYVKSENVVLEKPQKRNHIESSKKKEKVQKEVKIEIEDVYAIDIDRYVHFMEVEDKRRPMCDYMQRIQEDITIQMRGILVDRLVKIAEVNEFVEDTLYLTVLYIDRFLSSKSIHRQRLELLGFLDDEQSCHSGYGCFKTASRVEDKVIPFFNKYYGPIHYPRFMFHNHSFFNFRA